MAVACWSLVYINWLHLKLVLFHFVLLYFLLKCAIILLHKALTLYAIIREYFQLTMEFLSHQTRLIIFSHLTWKTNITMHNCISNKIVFSCVFQEKKDSVNQMVTYFMSTDAGWHFICCKVINIYWSFIVPNNNFFTIFWEFNRKYSKVLILITTS